MCVVEPREHQGKRKRYCKAHESGDCQGNAPQGLTISQKPTCNACNDKSCQCHKPGLGEHSNRRTNACQEQEPGTRDDPLVVQLRTICLFSKLIAVRALIQCLVPSLLPRPLSLDLDLLLMIRPWCGNLFCLLGQTRRI